MMVRRATTAVTMVSKPRATEPPLKSYILWLDSASGGRLKCNIDGLRFAKVRAAPNIGDFSTPWKRDGTLTVMMEASAAAARHINNAVQCETPPA